MYQFFSRPDLYIGRCGQLKAYVQAHPIQDAPAFMRGIKALFVTDPHVLPNTTQRQLDDLMALIDAQKADILLLGGDYADNAEDTRRFFCAFSHLTPARFGAWGVLGNNDREAWQDIGTLTGLMQRSGCAPLVNVSARLPINGGELVIAGVDEYLRGRPDAKGLYPDTASRNQYRVLLSHQPHLPDPSPDLMLCGHTHGGQFNLLGITPYSIGYERVFSAHRAPQTIAGLRSYRGSLIFTGKGIGASKLQLRIGVRPQIDLLLF